MENLYWLRMFCNCASTPVENDYTQIHVCMYVFLTGNGSKYNKYTNDDDDDDDNNSRRSRNDAKFSSTNRQHSLVVSILSQ